MSAFYEEFVQKIGNRPSKKLSFATTLLLHQDGSLSIRLYKTDILTIHVDRIVTNFGGWPTQTTMRRINTYLPSEFPRIKTVKGTVVWATSLKPAHRDGDYIDFLTGDLRRADGTFLENVLTFNASEKTSV